MALESLRIIADCIYMHPAPDAEHTKLTCFQINYEVMEKLYLLKRDERIECLVFQTVTDVGDEHTVIHRQPYEFVSITPLSDKHRRVQTIVLRPVPQNKDNA